MTDEDKKISFQPEVRRLQCAQCGREGTRGFKTYPANVYQGISLDPLTVCAAQTACARRWPPRRTYVNEYD